MQYLTIQYLTLQYNAIQYNTLQYNAIPYNTIPYLTVQCNTIQYNTIQYQSPVNKIKFSQDVPLFGQHIHYTGYKQTRRLHLKGPVGRSCTCRVCRPLEMRTRQTSILRNMATMLAMPTYLLQHVPNRKHKIL
jgi:hypothetical protein